jgi:hypothetical protein
MKAVCLYAYEGRDAGELSFEKDDIVVLLNNTGSDWWSGYLEGGAVGEYWFPRDYVQLVNK